MKVKLYRNQISKTMVTWISSQCQSSLKDRLANIISESQDGVLSSALLLIYINYITENIPRKVHKSHVDL